MKHFYAYLVAIFLIAAFSSEASAQIGAKNLLTFERVSNSYYSGDLEGALGILNANSYELQDGKDRLLYQLYKGTILSELGKYAESNQYFSMAYETIDVIGADVGKKSLSMLTNPLVTNFEGNEFEQLMIHYYKIYNYLALGDNQAALNELQAYNNRVNLISSKSRKFNPANGFFMMLAGIVYEQNKKYNEAYDAYVAAYNYYQSYGATKGLVTPDQLKHDIVNMAGKMQNAAALQKYESLFNIKYAQDTLKTHSVIVFLNNGQSPVKKESVMTLQPTRMAGGLGFVDIQTGEQFPAGAAAAGAGINRFLGGGQSKLAYPYYESTAEKFTTFSIGTANTQQLTSVENVDYMLHQIHKMNKLKEVGSIMARMLSKSVGKNLAKRGLKKAASYIPGVSNFSGLINKGIDKGVDKLADKTEKADTRAWLLLPNKIYYTRVDLPVGEQNIEITASNAMGESKTFSKAVNITPGQLAMANFTVKDKAAGEDNYAQNQYANSNVNYSQNNQQTQQTNTTLSQEQELQKALAEIENSNYSKLVKSAMKEALLKNAQKQEGDVNASYSANKNPGVAKKAVSGTAKIYFDPGMVFRKAPTALYVDDKFITVTDKGILLEDVPAGELDYFILGFVAANAKVIGTETKGLVKETITVKEGGEYTIKLESPYNYGRGKKFRLYKKEVARRNNYQKYVSVSNQISIQDPGSIKKLEYGNIHRPAYNGLNNVFQENYIGYTTFDPAQEYLPAYTNYDFKVGITIKNTVPLVKETGLFFPLYLNMFIGQYTVYNTIYEYNEINTFLYEEILIGVGYKVSTKFLTPYAGITFGPYLKSVEDYEFGGAAYLNVGSSIYFGKYNGVGLFSEYQLGFNGPSHFTFGISLRGLHRKRAEYAHIMVNQNDL